jgi:hypothetical protein
MTSGIVGGQQTKLKVKTSSKDDKRPKTKEVGKEPSPSTKVILRACSLYTLIGKRGHFLVEAHLGRVVCCSRVEEMMPGPR